jgi:hypothetical protein
MGWKENEFLELKFAQEVVFYGFFLNFHKIRCQMEWVSIGYV